MFTPGRAPLDELAAQVARLTGGDAAQLRRELMDNPAGFTATVRLAVLKASRAAAGQAGSSVGEGRLLIIVDQFEQVFTQCAADRERESFVKALCAAAGYESAAPGQGTGHAPLALVVLSVRADFEANCGSFAELMDAVQRRYLVMPMTEQQLRMAITEPAKAADSRVDEDLTAMLLDEVRTRQGQPGAAGVLPQLSHALDRAWRSRTGQILMCADYENAGGITRSVADSAERAYHGLTMRQQTIAEEVFGRLTATTAAGTHAARRATRTELTVGTSAAESADVAAVLEAFASQCLLTLGNDSIEISHERLLEAWPRLRDDWLPRGAPADRAALTQLQSNAAEWHRHQHDRSYLYGATRLRAAREAVRPDRRRPRRHRSAESRRAGFPGRQRA